MINDFKNISNRSNEYTSDRKYYQSNPYITFKLGKINLKDIPYEQETGIYSIVLAIADVGKTPPTHIDETSDPIDFKFNESIHDSSISSDSYYIYKKNLENESNKNDVAHYYAVRAKKMSYLYFINFKVDKKADVIN